MLNRKRTATAIAATGLAAVLALTGCGTHSNAADPTSDNTKSGSNQRVIKEPYGFRNVAFSCLGPNGVYVTSAGSADKLPSSVAVVVNDPNCK